MGKISVLFKTTEQTDIAIQNLGWMSHCLGVRIAEDRGFPVKVDGVDTLTKHHYGARKRTRHPSEQCYNCQEVGHKALNCRKTQRLSYCSHVGIFVA
jgi:hypothetical protein